jgi:histidine triad (HIT) family protein
VSDCLFCRIVAGEIPSARVYEDADAIAFLDIAPFKRGHTLVVSKRHVPNALADADVLATLAPAVTAVGTLLTERLGADGMNILTNVNEVAGQSVFHLHVHLIPRYADDPGFAALVRRAPAADDLDAVRAALS